MFKFFVVFVLICIWVNSCDILDRQETICHPDRVEFKYERPVPESRSLSVLGLQRSLPNPGEGKTPDSREGQGRVLKESLIGGIWDNY